MGSTDWLESIPEANGAIVMVAWVRRAFDGMFNDQILPTTSVTLSETDVAPSAGNSVEAARIVSGVNLAFPRKSTGPAAILKLPEWKPAEATLVV